jgi:hypothetical protein
MTTAVLKEGHKMGRRKKPKEPHGRIEFQAPEQWIERIERQARRLGITISAYIRLVTTRQLERDEAEDPEFRAPERK